MKTLLFTILCLCAFAGVKAQTITADTTVYTKVDKEPEFVGGKSKFYQFLGKTTRYPANAREHNIQGKVELSFIVETDGKLSNIIITKSVAPDIDAEALRVLSLSPNWSPGVKDGHPVRTRAQTPFNFALAY
ncbi:energy transducer TonB [Mucilaginibacter lutimaris]|uniref:Energy transducer TonB n=1 Tax=Mucilaginibacter lutimaris TaxID=931629 RepID=A0ABW2ZFL4_9SPHI